MGCFGGCSASTLRGFFVLYLLGVCLSHMRYPYRAFEDILGVLVLWGVVEFLGGRWSTTPGVTVPEGALSDLRRHRLALHRLWRARAAGVLTPQQHETAVRRLSLDESNTWARIAWSPSSTRFEPSADPMAVAAFFRTLSRDGVLQPEQVQQAMAIPLGEEQLTPPPPAAVGTSADATGPTQPPVDLAAVRDASTPPEASADAGAPPRTSADTDAPRRIRILDPNAPAPQPGPPGASLRAEIEAPVEPKGRAVEVDEGIVLWQPEAQDGQEAAPPEGRTEAVGDGVHVWVPDPAAATRSPPPLEGEPVPPEPSWLDRLKANFMEEGNVRWAEVLFALFALLAFATGVVAIGYTWSNWDPYLRFGFLVVGSCAVSLAAPRLARMEGLLEPGRTMGLLALLVAPVAMGALPFLVGPTAPLPMFAGALVVGALVEYAALRGVNRLALGAPDPAYLPGFVATAALAALIPRLLVASPLRGLVALGFVVALLAWRGARRASPDEWSGARLARLVLPVHLMVVGLAAAAAVAALDTGAWCFGAALCGYLFWTAALEEGAGGSDFPTVPIYFMAGGFGLMGLSLLVAWMSAGLWGDSWTIFTAVPALLASTVSAFRTGSHRPAYVSVLLLGVVSVLTAGPEVALPSTVLLVPAGGAALGSILLTSRGMGAARAYGRAATALLVLVLALGAREPQEGLASSFLVLCTCLPIAFVLPTRRVVVTAIASAQATAIFALFALVLLPWRASAGLPPLGVEAGARAAAPWLGLLAVLMAALDRAFGARLDAALVPTVRRNALDTCRPLGIWAAPLGLVALPGLLATLASCCPPFLPAAPWAAGAPAIPSALFSALAAAALGLAAWDAAEEGSRPAAHQVAGGLALALGLLGGGVFGSGGVAFGLGCAAWLAAEAAAQDAGDELGGGAGASLALPLPSTSLAAQALCALLVVGPALGGVPVTLGGLFGALWMVAAGYRLNRGAPWAWHLHLGPAWLLWAMWGMTSGLPEVVRYGSLLRLGGALAALGVTQVWRDFEARESSAGGGPAHRGWAPLVDLPLLACFVGVVGTVDGLFALGTHVLDLLISASPPLTLGLNAGGMLPKHYMWNSGETVLLALSLVGLGVTLAATAARYVGQARGSQAGGAVAAVGLTYLLARLLPGVGPAGGVALAALLTAALLELLDRRLESWDEGDGVLARFGEALGGGAGAMLFGLAFSAFQLVDREGPSGAGPRMDAGLRQLRLLAYGLAVPLGLVAARREGRGWRVWPAAFLTWATAHLVLRVPLLVDAYARNDDWSVFSDQRARYFVGLTAAVTLALSTALRKLTTRPMAKHSAGALLLAGLACAGWAIDAIDALDFGAIRFAMVPLVLGALAGARLAWDLSGRGAGEALWREAGAAAPDLEAAAGPAGVVAGGALLGAALGALLGGSWFSVGALAAGCAWLVAVHLSGHALPGVGCHLAFTAAGGAAAAASLQAVVGSSDAWAPCLIAATAAGGAWTLWALDCLAGIHRAGVARGSVLASYPAAAMRSHQWLAAVATSLPAFVVLIFLAIHRVLVWEGVRTHGPWIETPGAGFVCAALICLAAAGWWARRARPTAAASTAFLAVLAGVYLGEWAGAGSVHHVQRTWGAYGGLLTLVGLVELMAPRSGAAVRNRAASAWGLALAGAGGLVFQVLAARHWEQPDVAVALAALAPTLVGLALFRLAVRQADEELVYLGELAVAGSFLYLRVTGILGVTLVGQVALQLVAFALLGAAQKLDGTAWSTLARPFRRTATVLPAALLVRAALTPVDWLGWDGWGQFSLGCMASAFYALAGQLEDRALLRWMAGLCAYVGLALLFFQGFGWEDPWVHLDAYLVPFGMLIVLFSKLEERNLLDEQQAALRQVGLLMVYVSPMAHAVWTATAVETLALIVLGCLGVVFGVATRLRLYQVYGGVSIAVGGASYLLNIYRMGWVNFSFLAFTLLAGGFGGYALWARRRRAQLGI